MTEVLGKDVLKALSSGTRQEILKLLAKRPYTASELAKLLNKHVTTVAEHLDALERAGLIAKKDSGNKWIYYTLAPKGDRLFKPQFYSWTLLLALSVIGVFAGLGNFITTRYSSFGKLAQEYARMPADAPAATVATPPAIDFFLLLSIALIALGMLGVTIAVIKLRAKTSIILQP